MSDPVDLLGLYLHLARASELQRQPHDRDRLLVISGVIAARARLPQIAAYCRHKILDHNPQHLIRRWPTLEAALEQSDFLHLFKQIQRRYPQEKAERLLTSLGIQMGRERQTYYTDEEYAAALLGVTPQSLGEMFGPADNDPEP